jgi:hypothetical protein
MLQNLSVPSPLFWRSVPDTDFVRFHELNSENDYFLLVAFQFLFLGATGITCRNPVMFIGLQTLTDVDIL